MQTGIKKLIIVFVCAILCGCVQKYKKADLAKLQIGMTRDQVYQTIGPPKEVLSAKTSDDGKIRENLGYEFWVKSFDYVGIVPLFTGSKELYLVVLEDGKLKSYGLPGHQLSHSERVQLLGVSPVNINLDQKIEQNPR